MSRSIKVCGKCLRNSREVEFGTSPNLCKEHQSSYNSSMRRDDLKSRDMRGTMLGENTALARAFGKSIMPSSAYIDYLESEQRRKDKAEADLSKTVERFKPIKKG